MSQLVLVFDTSPLNHFAQAGEFQALRKIVEGWRCVVTRAVREELKLAVDTYPILEEVLSAEWLETVRVDGLEELYVFADVLNHLGDPTRNAGEASVLAWAKVNGGVVYIDDQAAYNQARQLGVRAYRTLGLVVQALKRGLFSEVRAQELVRQLADTGAWFPGTACTNLITWARDEGLLEPYPNTRR